MSVEIVIPWDGMTYVRDNWNRYLDDYMRAIGNRLRKILPGLIMGMLGKYKTGNLASTAKAGVGLREITVTLGPAWDVSSGTGHDYAPDVIYGADPWSVDQRAEGKTWPMRWSHKGGSGVAWKVRHPGQPARPDIVQAIIEAAKQIAAEELMIFKLMEAGAAASGTVTP